MTNFILFQDKKVRRMRNEVDQKGYFSIVGVVKVLTGIVDSKDYWRKLKERLKIEGNETVTNCHSLKMEATDGKMRLTDVADTEQLLRLIQSIPSAKEELFKNRIVSFSYERLDGLNNLRIFFINYVNSNIFMRTA